MRRSVFVLALALAACGQSRMPATRARARVASPPTEFVQLVGIQDPSCGPDVLPPTPPGRFPGPCSTTSHSTAENFVVSYGYEGDRVSSWSNVFETKGQWWDDAGRLTNDWLTAGDCADSDTWVYDDAGRLAEWDTWSCGGGWIYRYHFDDRGRLVSADLSDSERGPLQVTYVDDDAGSPLHAEVTWPDGGTLWTEDWTYDHAQRVTSHDWSLSGLSETWSYDEQGRVVLHSKEESGTSRTWDASQYIGALQVASGSWTSAGGWGTVTSYCANGLPHAVTSWLLDGDGGRTTYQGGFEYWYGPAGVWTRMTDLDAGTTIATQTLDDAGNVLALDGIAAPHVVYPELTHATYDYSCFSAP